MGWTPWDLQYEITRSVEGQQFNTSDGSSMPWYAPFWSPALLNGTPVPASPLWSRLLLLAACFGVAYSTLVRRTQLAARKQVEGTLVDRAVDHHIM